MTAPIPVPPFNKRIPRRHLRSPTSPSLPTPGQLTAIVGISGSGKSTAAALLAGTLTGYQESLTLNDVKVSDPSGETLARTITLIGASSHLFAGTLRENLLMALPDDGQNGDVASDAANLSSGQLRLQRRPR